MGRPSVCRRGEHSAAKDAIPDILLTNSYLAMTPFRGVWCRRYGMRTTAIFLLAAVLGTGALRAQPSVALEAATDRQFYREGAESEVYIEARIRATGSAAQQEPAAATVRNITFVLDRSGSMAGEPVQALRQAVVGAIGSLAERDVVSVVLFGSEVETLIEAQRRDQAGDLEARFAQIEPAGGSALYDALNQGAAQLRRYAGTSTVNHLVLVTDGPATKGPRESDDFVRLVEVFAREGITLSAIGLGEEFDEDLLAALARAGNGRFRFVDQPDGIAGALQAEIAPMQTVVAHDAELTVEFKGYCRGVKSHGWEPAAIADTTVTYRFPHFFADQDLAVLASGKVDSFIARNYLHEVATVRLRWRDAASGATREVSKAISLHFSTDDRAVRETINAGVFRTAVGTLISEGMQEAIEFVDKGDFRRALRALRRARDDAKSMNYSLEDAQIAATIRQLETYLADVQARGMNQLDRKILRSGLFNQFEIPTAEDEGKN
jgi:Ca-activated chloride channel homolog